MSMSTRTYQENNHRLLNSDKMRSLAFQLKMLMSDHVNGDFNHRTKENKPGTGRPWTQVEPVRIYGIDGWAAVDGFERFNQPFVPLTQNDAVSAVLM